MAPIKGWVASDVFRLCLGPPGFSWRFYIAPVFQRQCCCRVRQCCCTSMLLSSTSMLLSSTHHRFILVLILDFFLALFLWFIIVTVCFVGFYMWFFIFVAGLWWGLLCVHLTGKELFTWCLFLMFLVPSHFIPWMGYGSWFSSAPFMFA